MRAHIFVCVSLCARASLIFPWRFLVVGTHLLVLELMSLAKFMKSLALKFAICSLLFWIGMFPDTLI